MSYLDKNGLEYFWQKIKDKIPTKTSQIDNDSGYLTLATLPKYDGGVT